MLKIGKFQGVIIKLIRNTEESFSKKLISSAGGYNFFLEKLNGTRYGMLIP